MKVTAFTDRLLTAGWSDVSLNFQRIGVYRRIFHAMWPHITEDRLRKRAQKFFQDVKLGMSVTFRSIPENFGEESVPLSGRIVFDFDDMETCGVNLGMTGLPFTIRGGNRAAVSKFFGVKQDYTQSDLARKYLLRNESSNYFLFLVKAHLYTLDFYNLVALVMVLSAFICIHYFTQRHVCVSLTHTPVFQPTQHPCHVCAPDV